MKGLSQKALPWLSVTLAKKKKKQSYNNFGLEFGLGTEAIKS